MAENTHNPESKEAASTPEGSGLDESTFPEFRSHTKRKPDALAASYSRLYRKDQGVWLIGARAMKGPYTIANVNSNGTYKLNDERGTPFKDHVRERDLAPL